MYTHMSKKKIDINMLEPRYGNQFRTNPLFYNPRGLWYSYGDSWIRHMINKEEYSKYYFYEFDITGLKICKISTLAELDAFNLKYLNKEAIDLAHVVDWMKVKEEYDGLQICPYLSGKYSDMFTYIHNNMGMDKKVEINGLLFNDERDDKDFSIIPVKYRNEMKKMCVDNIKYMRRMWCIGWEVPSGVIWKGYGKLNIKQIEL